MRWNKTIVSLMAASGLAIPSVALAQASQQPVPSTDTQPPAADPTISNDPTSQAPAPAQGPSTDQPPSTEQGAPPVAETAPANPQGNPQVVAFVNSQFPAADTNGDGSLSKEEFDAWVSKMKVAEAQQQGKTVDQAEVTNYATVAFAQADADKSQSISRTELTQFLQG